MSFLVYGNGLSSNVLSVPSGWSIMNDSGIGGIQESVPGEMGPQAIVAFKVNNSDERYSFVNQLLGQWSGTPPSTITYSGPYQYPPSPSLVCTGIQSIECLGSGRRPMFGIGFPWMWSKEAVVKAVFTRPPWQASTNRGYFSISFSAGGEVYDVPGTVLKFGDGTPLADPFGIPIPHAQITVTRYRVPFIPDAIAVPLLGSLNNAPFGIGWNTYNTGTLIFDGFSSDIDVDPLGNVTYTIQYIFKFRWIPWNWALHPNGTTGWAAVTDRSGSPPLPSASFDLLP